MKAAVGLTEAELEDTVGSVRVGLEPPGVVGNCVVDDTAGGLNPTLRPESLPTAGRLSVISYFR